MIKSSKNGRMILLKSRLNISLLISLLICILFAFIEFVTKYIIFDLGNLNAGVESLMIERTMHLPYIISDLSIWQFIVLLYLFYLIISVMISIIGLLVSKISRGNIEAFSIMSVIIVGVSYILNISWLVCNDFSIKRLNMSFADFERAMQKAGYKLPEPV